MQTWMIVLLVLLAALCLLGSLKIGGRVTFGEALRVWIKIGPFMLSVYPMAERKKKPKRAKKEAEKNAAPEKEKPRRSITFDAVWALVQELLPLALNAMERVRKGMRIRLLQLHLVMGDANPALAARRYGKVNAILWPLLAAVENTVTVERRQVSLDLDFACRKTEATGEVFLTMRLHHALRIFLADGIPMICALLRFLKKTDPKKQKNAEQNKTAPDRTEQNRTDAA